MASGLEKRKSDRLEGDAIFDLARSGQRLSGETEDRLKTLAWCHWDHPKIFYELAPDAYSIECFSLSFNHRGDAVLKKSLIVLAMGASAVTLVLWLAQSPEEEVGQDGKMNATSAEKKAPQSLDVADKEKKPLQPAVSEKKATGPAPVAAAPNLDTGKKAVKLPAMPYTPGPPPEAVPIMPANPPAMPTKLPPMPMAPAPLPR